MYQNLVINVTPEAPASVHMNDWVTVKEDFLDTGLEMKMDIIRQMVEASSNARQKLKRKLRWPVKRIVVAPSKDEVPEAVASLESVLKEQTNAKEIVVLKPGESWDELGVEVLPNHAALGPAFKKEAGKVIAELKKADGRAQKTW
jgi:isoleucyl-tRNA synthetase